MDSADDDDDDGDDIWAFTDAFVHSAGSDDT